MPDAQVTAKRAIVVSAKAATAGSWYYGFACRGCGDQIAVFDDKSGGEKPPAATTGHFTVTCPSCADAGTYEASEMKSFQAG